MKNKDKTVSLGWAGRWNDGSIGWFTPRHVGGYPEPPALDPNNAGEPCYRVRVTVEVVKNKRGKSIKRYFPKAKP